ncbi:hypothetical protein LTR08_000011 [Meristemomyces frigidus]|nr:hypothetical protein LTR08_000011 [Meristemomyces frigidus]
MTFSSLLLVAVAGLSSLTAAAPACSYNNAWSTSRTLPPCGAVIVDQTGHHGNYTSVQAGVNALSTTQNGTQTLFIYPGVYIEQVYIPPRAANLTLYGWTRATQSYHGNTVNITHSLSLANTTSDDLTATVRAWTTNFKMYNINILNTFGHAVHNGQALALSAHTTNQGYYGVGLFGYQDTLLANTGKQLYAKSKITGAVDFIFGQHAQAWLEGIDIRTVAAGCITASGRNATNDTSFYVISQSTVAGINATVDAQAGLNYLGRPWGIFARVVFQYTYLSEVINPAGWSIWDPAPMERISNVTFAEFANYGPGSFPTEGPRANFSEQLTEPVVREEILGDGYEEEWWVDMRYLS